MSDTLINKLEEMIDQAVETVELLRLQIEELEEKNLQLTNEIKSLKGKHDNWEQNLNQMLQKLTTIDLTQQSTSVQQIMSKAAAEAETV